MGQRSAEITELGGRILGVAVTAVYSQQAFARSLGIDFPLLSDWGRTVCAAYGVRYDTWKGHDGLAKRSLFVVDREGIVRYRWATDDAAVIPDFDEVVAVFAELQAENRARELNGDQPLTYGTAVREHEIDGYGSTATWSRRS